MNRDESYMSRALELARHGELDASPNPMVGCVIVDGTGKIVGEGWHRKCGQGHAEVNAVAQLPEALDSPLTVYVTLEPCAHQGRTPPCADMLCRLPRVKRVVVGCVDPFAKVHGKGIRKLRDAGIEVDLMEGEIADKCRGLNAKFFRACRGDRPFVTLKWAQGSNGMMHGHFSTPATQTLVHRERALHDGIMIGKNTEIIDKPLLDVRRYAGRPPVRTVVENVEDIETILADLHKQGVTSVLVEGGAKLLDSFIRHGAWDAARVEIGPEGDSVPAPAIPFPPVKVEKLDGNVVLYYCNPKDNL